MLYVILVIFIFLCLAQFAVDLGAENQPVRWLVKNTGATTIQRGHVAELDAVTAGNPLGELLGNIATGPQIVLPVVIGTVDPNILADQTYVGVATEDIKQNEHGYLCVVGLAFVVPDAAMANSGIVIAPAANGEVLAASQDAATIPIGLMLQTITAAEATANTRKIAIVNFLNSFGNPCEGDVYAKVTKFMGKSY